MWCLIVWILDLCPLSYFILKLKIKHNYWLLVDTCPQAANHCALFCVGKQPIILLYFEFETVLKFITSGSGYAQTNLLSYTGQLNIDFSCNNSSYSTLSTANNKGAFQTLLFTCNKSFLAARLI